MTRVLSLCGRWPTRSDENNSFHQLLAAHYLLGTELGTPPSILLILKAYAVGTLPLFYRKGKQSSC